MPPLRDSARGYSCCWTRPGRDEAARGGERHELRPPPPAHRPRPQRAPGSPASQCSVSSGSGVVGAGAGGGTGRGAGCLHVSPGSAAGRRLYLGQAVLLPFLPIAALIAQNCATMANVTRNNQVAHAINHQIELTVDVVRLLTALQEERARVAYVVMNDLNRTELLSVFHETNATIQRMQCHAWGDVIKDEEALWHHLDALRFSNVIIPHTPLYCSMQRYKRRDSQSDGLGGGARRRGRAGGRPARAAHHPVVLGGHAARAGPAGAHRPRHQHRRRVAVGALANTQIPRTIT